MTTYYNPTINKFHNPGASSVTFGFLKSDEEMATLGYYPYVDPMAEDRENIYNILVKDTVQIHNNTAIQTYRLSSSSINSINRVRTKLTSFVQAVDDTAAAAAGVEIGELYNNNGEVRIRMV